MTLNTLLAILIGYAFGTIQAAYFVNSTVFCGRAFASLFAPSQKSGGGDCHLLASWARFCPNAGDSHL